MQQTIVLTWQLSEIHGWGLVGLHTALHLLDQGRTPLLAERPLLDALRPANRMRVEPLLDAQQRLAVIVRQAGDNVLCLEGTTVLQALGNGFVPGVAARLRGSRTVGVIAFENTLFDADVLGRAQEYDRIVVHSTYNLSLLTEQGFRNVGLAFQGVDPDELAPAAAVGRFGDRFVVFSGGKIEFRKGQDIVLAAFRRFRERRPDALLVTAWHNHWPGTSASIAESPYTPTPPAIGENGRLRIVEWAMAHGVAPDGFIDMGVLARDQLAPILADCHAAVFPNRCEGATNLVAMEAMACGVPVILSANTGHLDLIREGNCLPLSRQPSLPDPDGSRRGWGESSVDELVEQLDRLYTDRAAARDCAEKGRAFVRGERTWRAFARSFVEAVD
ncbi:glycosyltransferase family 4 protein [Azospirillum picis]|uniref:Glycosyltransferase involved in cell wall biosynthesis n=1 Tax=Azospirillum picis TaxID=488438 RepID=A0ABU0MSN1_9PROT|nr:glycosyltransferase family 4 protein [Azospirillum picis]MBP2302747.1 glycosyltransferase involved in cell wall biosynthesis [Azospirillum picis]MDQ0536498.1 glycosyltransferase involved in cell wall biosynthesis [Azospirillum picis]